MATPPLPTGWRGVTKAVVGFVLSLTIVTMAMAHPERGADFGWAALNGLLLCGMYAIALAAHELAHAAVARLLRLEVHAIRIGVGPPVIRTRIGGVRVYVNLIPTGGLVLLGASSPAWARTRAWLTILAGPAINLAIAIGIVIAYADGDRFIEVALASGPAFAITLALANLGIGLFNLFPGRGHDGRKLATIPFRPGFADDLMVAGHTIHAERALAAGQLDAALAAAQAGLALRPGDLACENVIALVALTRDDVAAAELGFRRLNARSDLTAAARAIVRNNLAWIVVNHGGPEGAAEGEALSAQAIAVLPLPPELHGTRGAALIATGRVDEGLRHSRRGFAGASSDRNRAANAAWIAIGEAAGGDLDAARAHLAIARRLGLRPPALLARAEAAVADAARCYPPPP